MPYTSQKPPFTDTADQLRARIPGWGVDLDPKDRPSVPKERFDPSATGAHWDFPERQPEKWPRERSIEHKFLTRCSAPAAHQNGSPEECESSPIAATARAGRRIGSSSSRPTGSMRLKAISALWQLFTPTIRSPRPALWPSFTAMASTHGSASIALMWCIRRWIRSLSPAHGS